MLTPDQINVLRDKVSQLTDPVLEFLLEDIARRVSEAGQLTSSASYQIWRAQQLGMSQREVKKEIKKRLRVSNRELRKLLTQSAEVGYDFDIRRFPYVQKLPFNENEALQRIVQGTIDMVGGEFNNLTQTLGMVAPNGETVAVDDIYRKCCDEAFRLVNTGAADYNTAIRRATKNLADKGLRTIDYESGVSRSIESAVRGSVMGGMGLMQEQISKQTHDEFGCDGWEISAHAASAPDHEPIQGKQYSDADYTALNNSLVRRIGTLNCGHAAFPIILGVNAPQYTDEELEKLRKDNADGVVIDGRHYTKYEATQMQRKIEQAIRKQKNRILVDESAGDKDKLLSDQIRLQRYRQEYMRFSKAAGLRTQNERSQVAGFGRKQAAEAVAAVKNNERNLRFIEKDAIIKASSGLPKRIEEEDTIVPYTVNVDLPKLVGIVPSGTVAVEVYTMAGDGTSVPIRDLKRLYASYPDYGDASGWKKKSGTVHGKHHRYIVHWYENTGGIPQNEIKLKGAK